METPARFVQLLQARGPGADGLSFDGGALTFNGTLLTFTSV